MNRLGRVLWTNLLVIAGLLLLLELGSRLWNRVDLPDPLITQRRADWKPTREFDSLLFWRMQPGVKQAGGDLTNSLGLRGPEVPPKAAHEFRIISLGESTTFGYPVSFDETYSARLEEKLGEVDGKPVRVVNAGSPGYTLFQGVTYLKYRGLSLDPDAVLVYFGHNDFLPISFRVEKNATANETSAGLTDSEAFQHHQRLSSRLALFLAKHSNFARVLLFGRHRDLQVAVDASTPRVPPHDRHRLLVELKNLAREHELRLVILVPWYLEFEGHIPLLREFAAKEAVPLVDLPRAFRSLPQPRSDYFFDDIHPNAAGHELIARVLADELPTIWDPEHVAPDEE